MIEIIITIWVIGYMFTIGVAIAGDPDPSYLLSFFTVLILIIAWPTFLGIIWRQYIQK